jgi:hypothetical protein
VGQTDGFAHLIVPQDSFTSIDLCKRCLVPVMDVGDVALDELDGCFPSEESASVLLLHHCLEATSVDGISWGMRGHHD